MRPTLRLPFSAALLGIALLLAPVAAAQPTFDVTGVVFDAADGQPLSGATVLFVRASPDSAQSGAAALLDGTFRVTLAPGSYRLRVSFVGYLALERDVTVAGPLALGPLRLTLDASIVGEVEVAATRRRVEVRGDTTAFNADAFPVNPDASAQDLLAKLPGVTIENGTVTAQGETVQRVLVDGREFFGSDVQGALNTLPADIVQEVQIFDRSSEASRFSGFDDGDAEKTVNIVTRSGMQNGQFGRVYAGGGAGGEYLAGGNLSALDGDRRITVVALSNNVDRQNFATEDLLGVVSSTSGRGGRGGRAGGGPPPGGEGGGGSRRGGGSADVSALLVADQEGVNTTNAVGVNYSDRLMGGALSLTGSYVYNETDNDLDASLTRAYTSDGIAGQNYAETDASNGTNTNHQLSMRAQLDVTGRTQLVVEPRLTVQRNATAGALGGLTALPGGDVLGQSLTTDAVDARALSAQTQVLLRHRFETAGRTLTVGIDGSVDDQSGETRQTYVLDSFSDAITPDAADQLFDTDALTRSLGAMVRYTEPVGAQGQMQLSYRPQLSWSSSDQRAFEADPAGALTIPDAAYTSLFTQQSNVQRGGVSYRYGGQGREALSAQVGLDVQHERLAGDQVSASPFEVDRTFWSILPSARLRLPLSERATPGPGLPRPDADALCDAAPRRGGQLQPAAAHVGQPRPRPRDDAHAARPLQRHRRGRRIGRERVRERIVRPGRHRHLDDDGTGEHDLLASGVVLPSGAQLITPVNASGAWDARAVVSYGRPVPLLGSNANVSIGTSFARSPGLVNGASSVSDQTSIDGRLFVGSALSPRVDVSLEYGARYTATANSAAPSLDDTYVRHLAGVKATWLPWQGLVVGTDVQALYYAGLDASVDPAQVLVGARVGYKFLRNDLAEVSLSVSDLFDQQRSVERTVTESYVEDAQSVALGRYVMLNLTYKLRNFGL